MNLTSESNTASPANANIGVIVGGAVGGAAVFVLALYLLWKMRTILKRPQVNVEPSPVVLKRLPPDPAPKPQPSQVDTIPSIRNRHKADSLEPPQYKPLGLKEDFTPLKTCREYVEQDCSEALPVFRPHSRALVRCGDMVSPPGPAAHYSQLLFFRGAA